MTDLCCFIYAVWHGRGGLRGWHTTTKPSTLHPHQCDGGCIHPHPLRGGGMDKFSLARPNTEESASQGAHKAYVSSCFASRIAASWGAQSQTVVVSGRFAVQMTTSWSAQCRNAVVTSGFVCKSTCVICHTMVTCDCVFCSTPRAAFLCALRGPINICMDPRVPFSRPPGPTGKPRIFDFYSDACHRSRVPNFCMHWHLLRDQEFHFFSLMLATGPNLLLAPASIPGFFAF